MITEFVAGYMLPGRPIANVCFKCYGYMAMSQALDLAVDMKLGEQRGVVRQTRVWKCVLTDCASSASSSVSAIYEGADEIDGPAGVP